MATPSEGTSWTRPRSLACMDFHNDMLERARARSHELPRHVLERTKFTVACNRGENPGSQCCILLYADLLLGNLQQVLISKLWSGLAATNSTSTSNDYYDDNGSRHCRGHQRGRPRHSPANATTATAASVVANFRQLLGSAGTRM